MKAELVLKNAGIINVFTETVEYGDIAIYSGKIVGIGEYEGDIELDCTGKYVAPGFMDGHIHLESAMLRPVEFAKTVLPHGTIAVIADPHEITNVCGVVGMEYMLKATEGLPMEVFFTVPSCVPATSFDESGCVLRAVDLENLYRYERVLGLAEVMDYIGTIHGDPEILHKIAFAKQQHRIIDGHAPGLHGKEACAYVLAGIGSDHECVDLKEAMEKLRLGQWIMIRQGTAAKNLEALMGLFQPPFYQRTILVTDDKNPYELKEQGHMDEIIRQAVGWGANPCIAIKMATFNTATYFGLKNMGAIAPGYQADLVILSDLNTIKIEKVMKKGIFVVDGSNTISLEEPQIDQNILKSVYHSFHCNKNEPKDFEIDKNESHMEEKSMRVIRFIKNEIFTKQIIIPLENGVPEVSIKEDILKIAAIERHHNTNHIGLGFVNGYGLREGAIASSVSHDSHNIIVIGTNDTDIALASNCIRDMQGGWAIAVDGKIVANLPLPIAGLMSEMETTALAKKIDEMKAIARSLGVAEGIDPFMTMAFVSLPVIPELRLITTGLFDVVHQQLVSITTGLKGDKCVENK